MFFFLLEKAKFKWSEILTLCNEQQGEVTLNVPLLCHRTDIWLKQIQYKWQCLSCPILFRGINKPIKRRCDRGVCVGHFLIFYDHVLDIDWCPCFDNGKMMLDCGTNKRGVEFIVCALSSSIVRCIRSLCLID